jgi:hypothetical protein
MGDLGATASSATAAGIVSAIAERCRARECLE